MAGKIFSSKISLVRKTQNEKERKVLIKRYKNVPKITKGIKGDTSDNQQASIILFVVTR